MQHWRTLRRIAAGVYVAYGHTSTNNLRATDIRIRSEPSFELRMNLNGNLHVGNRQSLPYVDARDLADGAIQRLKLILIPHGGLVRKIDRYRRRVGSVPGVWRLTLELEGDWTFSVRPELHGPPASLLLLHVV